VAARPASSDVLLAMLKGRAGTPRHVGSTCLKPLQLGSRAATPRLDLRPHGQRRGVPLPIKNHLLGRIETERATVGALRTTLNPDPCRHDDPGNVGFWHVPEVRRTSAKARQVDLHFVRPTLHFDPEATLGVNVRPQFRPTLACQRNSQNAA
jgi:hypothetical protein